MVSFCAETQGRGLRFRDDPLKQKLRIHIHSITHTRAEEAVSKATLTGRLHIQV